METLKIGSVTVYPYGLVMALSAALALGLTAWQGKKHGVTPKTMSWFALLSIPLAVLGGRLAYCLVALDWVLDQGLDFFWQFTRGGYMFYGALLGGIAAAALACKITKAPLAPLLDSAVAPAALMLAIGRLAEPLVGLGYGHDIEEWFDPFEEKAMIAWENPEILFRFPLGEQNYYGVWCFAIYLPEALTALAICIALFSMKPRRAGGKAALGLLLYGASQPLWESMRQDEVLKWGFVRASQLFSAFAVLAVILICWFALRKEERKPAALIKAILILLLSCGVIMAMEFALEQKISFLTWMRMDVCYVVMALGCVGLALSALPLWRKAFPVKG